MADPALPQLSPLEARVLGVLVEKQLTTPDNYPLSLNALVAGCNQKTSREPVMNVSEEEAQGALDALKDKKLVINSWGASRRVVRYSHSLPQMLGTDQGTTALVATLMLRGPQTPGELRIACERMYRFADLSSVEAYLEEMARRSSGALAVRLPKQAGSREHRWAHLLSGTIDGPAESAAPQAPTANPGTLAALQAELNALRDEVAEIRQMIAELKERP
jgi:uncharacterized protein YceH (UPF0502 family)